MSNPINCDLNMPVPVLADHLDFVDADIKAHFANKSYMTFEPLFMQLIKEMRLLKISIEQLKGLKK